MANPAPTSTTPPTPSGSYLPNQQVAPFTPEQMQALGMTWGQTPGTQNFLNTAMGSQDYMASGALLSPNNPYLASYFNAAAAPMVQNYQQAVAPNILQNAAQTGTLGSAGMGQAFGNAETGLAQGLGNLAAGIYEPAYGQGLSATMQAAQGAPALAAGQYLPAQELYGMGQNAQTQAQHVLDTAYNNQYQQAMWPFKELSLLGGGLSGFGGGGGGTQITTSPYQSSGKG